MRTLVRLIILCATCLSLASVASAEKPADGEKKTPPGHATTDPAPAETGTEVAAPKGQEKEKAEKPDKPEKVKDKGTNGLSELVREVKAVEGAQTAMGKTVGAATLEGRVRVKQPGTEEYTELAEGAAVPVGTVVDATAGLVEIGAESADGVEQNAVVSGAVFRVDQSAAEGGVTDLVLQDGDFSACGKGEGSASTARAAAKRRAKGGQVARGLWAAGKGKFRTKGRFGTASVRGTRWATVDRCNSTTIKVFDGVVDVLNHATGKVVAVRAGERVVVPKP